MLHHLKLLQNVLFRERPFKFLKYGIPFQKSADIQVSHCSQQSHIHHKKLECTEISISLQRQGRFGNMMHLMNQTTHDFTFLCTSFCVISHFYVGVLETCSLEELNRRKILSLWSDQFFKRHE